MEQSTDQALPEELAVAIIGMAGRFPGAKDIQTFWQNLIDEVESITEFDEQRLRESGVSEELLAHQHYVKAGAYIEDIELFDPAFFDMTPREAEVTDPQHRVLLECAHAAFEHAGYSPDNYQGSVGVYAGVGLNTYLLSNLMPNTELLQSLGMHQLLLGNDKCYATSRIAYKLNFTGPCMSIDTACSSGLVSILTAYKALISYDCDMALAGGAKVNSADTGYLYEPGSINSPDGHCKTFDASANGTVFGSGAGMLLLKRLDEAVSDKDNILAVIRGGAINNDGSDKVGFTAPSVNRQRDVIKHAFAFSEVPTDSISYVEAHGTGTKLGDPVEIKALSEAFENNTAQDCYIGSVKTNIGHLESAAGVAGLMKVVMSLNEEVIPATLNFNKPNPSIEFEQTPFSVVSSNTAWPSHETPRRACVSSFGLGGTNSHLIVEEAPQYAERNIDSQAAELLLLSAKCDASLAQAKQALQDYFELGHSVPLKDVAHTLAVGRQAYPQRTIAVVDGSDAAPQEVSFERSVESSPGRTKTAWLIPGQGSQHAGMSRDLYTRFETYQQQLDECCRLFMQVAELDIKPLMLAEVGDVEASKQINQTLYSQAAIFTHAYSLAQQLRAWGIRPDVLLGHSLGEFVAVCLSEALSIEETIALVAKRASLMDSLEGGAMLSVSSDLGRLQALIQQHSLPIDIAALNTPGSVVVSGTIDAIESAESIFEQQGLTTRKLITSHAFHSSMLDPILAEFESFVATLSFHEPVVPYISSLTGDFISLAEMQQPSYWSRQIRETVQFTKSIDTLVASGVACALDLGPSDIASSMLRANLTTQKSIPVISCSPNHQATRAADHILLGAVGKYWCHGGKIDWPAFYQGRDCHRTALPGYQFQKQHLWVDPPMHSESKESSPLPVQESDPVAVDKSTVVTMLGDDAPRNDSEAMIADIWKELLGLKQVGIFDNFFELGGQSLLASRVITRIHEKTSVELDVSVMFDHPTIEGIAIELLKEQVAVVDDQEMEALLAELET